MWRLERRLRVLAVTAVAFAALPGLSASSAVAAGASDCLPGAGAGATARGGVVREPAMKHKAIEVPASGVSAAAFHATVPVYFHVITTGTTGNVSRRAIETQINVLNKTYGGGERGPATGFTFTLAAVDRTNNTKWYNAGPDSRAEAAMKRALHQGTLKDLNLYSTSGGGYLGWATFPTQDASQLFLDGVVMDWRSMKGTSDVYAGKFDQGETATHEIGHWVNLYHVFQDGCSTLGDRVADTPRQAIATSGCPAGQDSCAAPGVDSIHNYMDYSYDNCYTNFTPGQVKRMHAAWLNIRAA